MQRHTEQRMAICRAGLGQIERMLQDSPCDWEQYLNYARSITVSLDAVDYLSASSQRDEQIWIVRTLQKLAYQDADSGGVPWLADWCQRQWLRMMERNPLDVDALTGTGHHWLLKAQKHLSIIHREEASSSSGTSSGRTSDGRSTNGFAFGVPHAYTQQEDDAAAARATADAEARSHTPSYVEARALLVPATDLLSTAVDTASRQGTVSGALFCLAAEAYMSLGNVSSARVGEQQFAQAIRYLRQARAVPGYVLAPYLQHYLDDYGSLVN